MPAVPVVARTRAALEAAVAPTRAAHRSIGLVPTMGALHAGHRALLRAARHDDLVVASVFVNPLQFGPGEDLDRYPRSWDADLDVLAHDGVDVVFAPTVEEVYPEGPDGAVTVDPGPQGSVLEGASRPTHFRGVLTVVAKLFGLVRPDTAWFGEKDYQQLVLVRRMVRDLALGVDVRSVPVVREPDGLARSSRNAYLGPSERAAAPALRRALLAGEAVAAHGPGAVEAAVRAGLDAEPDLQPDYVAVTGPDLDKAPDTGPARVLVAARLGPVRLIDNAALVLGPPLGRSR